MKRFTLGFTFALAAMTVSAVPGNRQQNDYEIGGSKAAVQPKVKVSVKSRWVPPPMKPFASLEKNFAATAEVCRVHAKTFAERLKYEPLMIPYYTGTILPTPQKVRYADAFVSIADVGIVLGRGLKPDDASVAILIRRIELYGGNAKLIPASEARKHGLTISIGETGLAKGFVAPDHAEGYAFKTVEPKLIAVAYRDRLGLTWAMDSLRQLITENQMRLAEVEDYPATDCRRICSMPNGGLVGGQFITPVGVNALLQTRCSEVFWHWPLFSSRKTYWLYPEPFATNFTAAIASMKKITALLAPLGISWYGALQAGDLDSKNENHFRSARRIMEAFAESGGNFWFEWDDWRFLGLYSTNEIRNFGSCREADVYFVNKLIKTVREKYPNQKYLYCPPCYWKLAAGKPCWKESADAYWKAIATRMPKDMGVMWTGNHVFSTELRTAEVARVTGLLGRKPIYSQNRSLWGDHPCSVWYLGDAAPFKDAYDKGTPERLAGIMPNNGSHYSWTGSMGCYLWNEAAYDAPAVGKELAMRFVGPENYADLMVWHANISKIDPYYYRGKAKPSDEAVKRVVELEAYVRRAKEALVKVARARPAALACDLGQSMYYGTIAEGTIPRIRSDPRAAAVLGGAH